MENTIEIQKEFEILVKELERLKSINELTSSNADSAKNVVNEIDKFVKSVEHFKTAIDKDLKEKSSKIDLILKQLDETVLSIESNTQKSVNDHSEKLKELHEKSDLLINQNKDDFIKEVHKFKDELTKYNDIISLNISESEKSIISFLKISTNKVSSTAEKKINSIENKFFKETSSLQNSIQNTIIETINGSKQALEIKLNDSENKTLTRSDLALKKILKNNNEVKTSLIGKLDESTKNITITTKSILVEQEKQINSSFNNLNTLIEKQNSENLEILNQQNKEIKTLKVLLIITICLVVILSLLNYFNA